MIKFFLILLIFVIPLQTKAFEECIISTNGKLTDIKIENNKVVDVFPLITIMNNKNTLFIKPIQEGETSFSVLKNGKHSYSFDVKITKDKTEVNEVKGFKILTLDYPPNNKNFELDLPPKPKKICEENLPKGLRSGE